MKELRQVTVIGMGLLGGSVALTISGSMPTVKVVGFAHRLSTRKKACQLSIADIVTGDLKAAVADSDIVILATPISTFENMLTGIRDALKPGAIVTDVGSTKVLPHRWAAKCLSNKVHYIGSHPIAGSEQRGVEFSRDDLFEQADCIVTNTKKKSSQAAEIIKNFWRKMGCRVKTMTPAKHDRIYANVSHLPHITAAALLNANQTEQLKSAGKGFMDTSRVASGPANVWVDILSANSANCVKSIDRLIKQLEEFKNALNAGRTKKVEQLLNSARQKRAEMIEDKLNKRELIT